MKKNLAIIITKLEGGGAERMASNLSILLSEKYNVSLIVFDTKDIKYPYNGQLIDLGIPAANNPLNRIFNLVRRVKKLRDLKKKLNINFSISLLDGPNIVNILSRQEDRVIISVRNKLSFFVKSRLKKNRLKFLYNKADNVVSLSEMVKLDLIEEFGIKEDIISTIYNSCDTERILELSNENINDYYSDLFDDYEVIVTVGRLENQKAQWHLIRAFKKIKEVRPNAKLLIFGKGSLEEYLIKLVDELQLNEDVIFAGYVKNTFKYVKRSKVFVFSSVVEGLGNVLLEAMACGIPIVSTDCFAGPREIIAPNTNVKTSARGIEYGEFGILTPVCDGKKYDGFTSLTQEENFLAEAVIEVLSNNEVNKKYTEASLQRIKGFSPEVISKEWIKLIENKEGSYDSNN
ncbi:glycosyltransferase [Bacillus luti]|uniref:glycosyltransferase n=1 Tax=Bacillus luti TaxID=2026191 RepID=UPI0012E892C1|nr:glycosyltransferase [Bacillus luti]